MIIGSDNAFRRSERKAHFSPFQTRLVTVLKGFDVVSTGVRALRGRPCAAPFRRCREQFSELSVQLGRTLHGQAARFFVELAINRSDPRPIFSGGHHVGRNGVESDGRIAVFCLAICGLGAARFTRYALRSTAFRRGVVRTFLQALRFPAGARELNADSIGRFAVF